jgi:hypothetical protein
MLSDPKKNGYADETNWLAPLLKGSGVSAADLTYDFNLLRGRATKSNMCVLCKGGKFLCGKTRCSVLAKALTYRKIAKSIDRLDLDGASPPGVFIGRMGYPRIYAGPLVPPVHGDTTIMDIPELWGPCGFAKSIDDIIDFRLSLVRGKSRLGVDAAALDTSNRMMDVITELALAKGPVETEMLLRKKPNRTVVLDDDIQPFGPSAPIDQVKVGNVYWDPQLEKAYGDHDLKAADAVFSLYDNGVLVSRIQKAFSVGAFGIKKNRKLVPTRWSITAVDSVISKTLLEKVTLQPSINEYRVYESNYLDNRWIILMAPLSWSYELVEAWYPGTTWNPDSRNIVIFSDHEMFEGRTTYPDIGGCYFASRLAVAEKLLAERRQATVAVLRETHPGYTLPIGVWNVRESVRNALKNPPTRYNNLQDVINHVSSKFAIPLQKWLKSSKLLQELLYQTRITDYSPQQSCK